MQRYVYPRQLHTYYSQQDERRQYQIDSEAISKGGTQDCSEGRRRNPHSYRRQRTDAGEEPGNEKLGQG